MRALNGPRHKDGAMSSIDVIQGRSYSAAGRRNKYDDKETAA